MADYNFDALTPEDKANIKKELETARQLRGRFHTTPTLPKFSGTDVGRGEVDFETWKYMLTSLVEEQGYSEATLKTAIRKSLIGEAAQHLRNSGAADVAGITRTLELHYGEVLCETTTWQDFYSAKQRRLESATSWRIRLEEVLGRIEGQEDGSRNSKLRTQWWTQLYSKTLKTATRHKYDDADVGMDDLFVYVKKIEQEEQKDGRNTMAPLHGEESGRSEDDKFGEYMAKTDKKLEAMMTAIEKLGTTGSHGSTARRNIGSFKQSTRCFNCNDVGHMAKDCKDKVKGKKCFNCDTFGHMARDCRKPKKDGTNGEVKACDVPRRRRRRAAKRRKQITDPTTEMENDLNKVSASNDDLQRRILGPRNHEEVMIEGVATKALIDSGATVSTISRSFYQKHCSHRKTSQIEDVFRTGLNLTGFSGEHVPCTEYVALQTILPGLEDPMEVMVCIVGDHCHTNDVPALIGTNVMDKWKAALRKRYEGSGTVPPVNRIIDDWTVAGPTLGCVRTTASIRKLEPNSTVTITATADISLVRNHDREVLFAPQRRFDDPKGLQMATVMVQIPRRHHAVKVCTVLANNGSSSVDVDEGRRIGVLESIENVILPLQEENHIEDDEFLKMFDVKHLEDNEMQKFQKMLLTNKKIFAMKNTDLGCAKDVKHKIELEDDAPVKERYRRIPTAMFEAVRKEIMTMQEAGVIRESRSPYCSPVTIVTKKDGSPRVCIDLRRVNAKTKKDAKSMPRVNEIMDALSGARMFTSLDLQSGYWQVEIEEESKQYTAFTAGPLGFWEFNRMPFGQVNSGATFQRMMEGVLAELLFKECLVYIDDVVVYSSNFEEHIERLQHVFNKLSRCNLKLKPKKCKFFQQEISFLGFTATPSGVKKDEEKIRAVKEWPTPTGVKELRQFLGLAGYLRKYVESYATIARPLTELIKGYSTKKGSRQKNRKVEAETWKWTGRHQDAFEELKQRVCDDVELAYPDFEKTFYLSVDASLEGLGAVLEQEDDDGKMRPLAFASRRTTDAEKKYDAHKLEFLALRWAVVDQFAEYLSCGHFIIYTDNNPLTYIMKKKQLDAIAQRWVTALADFNFVIEYKPGRTNVKADALSRLYDAERQQDNKWRDWARLRTTGFHDDDDAISDEDVAVPMKKLCQDSDVWVKKQEDDPTTQLIRTCLEEDYDLRNKLKDAHENKWLKLVDDLHMEDGLLRCWIDDTKSVLVVPTAGQQDVARMYHEYGHHGRTKTLETLKDRFFWLDMRKTVEEVIQTCERCQRRKAKPDKTQLHHLKEANYPFQCISMDYLAIDVRRDEKYKLLTIVDNYTRFGFICRVRSEKAALLAKVLYEEVFTRFGFPEEIHTDQGRSFTSSVVKDLYSMLGVKPSTTTSYRPTGNSICERFNQTVIKALGTLEPEQKSRWWEHVSTVEMAYNTTMNEATGCTPFRMMYQRSARTPIDCVIDLPSQSARRHNFCEERKQAMRQMHEEQAYQMMKRHVRNEKNYNRSVRKTLDELDIGDRVLYKKMIKTNKIDDRWEYDVYIVTARVHEDSPVYVIQSSRTGKVVKAHRDHMVLFQERVGDRTRMRDIPTISSQIRDEPGRDSTCPDVEGKLGVWCGAAQTIEADGLVVVSTRKTGRVLHDGGTYKVVHDVKWSPTYDVLKDRVRAAFREIQRRHARNVALEVDGTLSRKQRTLMTRVLVEVLQDENEMTRLVLCISTRKEHGLWIELLLDHLRADTDSSESENDDDDEGSNYEYGVVLPETEDESAGSDDETSGDSSIEDEDDDIDKVDEDDVNRQDMQRPQRHTRERAPPQWYGDVMTH